MYFSDSNIFGRTDFGGLGVAGKQQQLSNELRFVKNGPVDPEIWRPKDFDENNQLIQSIEFRLKNPIEKETLH